MIKITKFPVIIFASPRTGSTALLYYIHQLYPENVAFCEPDLKDIDSFLKYSQSNTNYILKLMATTLELYPSSQVLSPDNFFIRIRRKNILNQIASNYVARERNTWGYTATDATVNTSPIDINEEKIQESINILRKNNECVNNVPVKFDLDLFYEDLPKINDERYVITPKPSNYADLKSAIATVLCSQHNRFLLDK